MKIKLRFAAISALLAFLTAPAYAAPLNVVESLDFSQQPWGSNLGSLDVGVNEIAGTVSGLELLECISGGGCVNIGNDRDYFSVYLPSGLRITGFELGISNFSYGGGNAGNHNGSYDSVTPDNVLGPGGSFAVSSDSTTSQALIDFPSPGLYGFGFQSPFSNSLNPNPCVPSQICISQTFAGTMTYNLKLTVETVSAVPEPASLTLLALGLAGIAYQRRKRIS